jgi:hypothetical protein
MSDVFTSCTNPEPSLSDGVTALAQSIGVRHTPNTAPDADAFVQAIKHNRAKLLEIKGILEEQNRQQTLKQEELNRREATIMKREARCAAWEELQRSNEAIALCYPRVRGWWYRMGNLWR